jgi:hypothetical protein
MNGSVMGCAAGFVHLEGGPEHVSALSLSNDGIGILIFCKYGIH